MTDDTLISVDEIAGLRWTKAEHLELFGPENTAGAIRALAERTLEEIARANAAEQDARNAIRERDAAHREVADRTADVRATERLADGLAAQRDQARAALARVEALCERGYGPAIVEIRAAIAGGAE